MSTPQLIHQSTLPTGPKAVQVGSKTYHVPQGAGVAQGPSGLVYVLYAATVHCLGQTGEIEIPPRIRGTLASHYFGAKQRQQQTATPTS
jgi:hypothetical protein